LRLFVCLSAQARLRGQAYVGVRLVFHVKDVVRLCGQVCLRLMTDIF
jgi:hypothetical protein